MQKEFLVVIQQNLGMLIADIYYGYRYRLD
jgi:hypothetical protein